MAAAGRIGRRIPSASSAFRPDPRDELRAWGGPRLVRGKRVLDVGCGDGRLALGVAPLAASVDGVDPDPDAIAGARKAARSARAANARFRVAPAQELPFPDASFDVVILSWTL